jgi:hypothetical protein
MRPFQGRHRKKEDRMHETRSTIQLAEEAPFDVSARGVTADLRRSDIEEAAHAGGGPAELLLDLRWGDGELVETRELSVEWSQTDLDRLLAATDSDLVTIAFDRDEMTTAINAETDVEAHGLRDKAIILTVVAVSALSTGGVAQAHPIGGVGGGAAPATTVGGAVAGSIIDSVSSPATIIGGAGAPVAPAATSPASITGGAGPAPTAPVSAPTTTHVSTSSQTPAQVALRGEAAARTTRITGGSSLPSGEDAALVGVAGLAIAAAGFAAAGTRRKTMRPA